MSITQSGGSTNVNEAGPTSDTYAVVLDALPAAMVEIVVDPDAQTSVGAGANNPILLTFTVGNWNQPQVVTVTAVDDAVVEGPHSSLISHTASSADSSYNGIGIVAVTANVTDNDSVGVVVTESNGSTTVSENGPTSDSYDVVLNSRPSAIVSITVTPDGQTDLGAGAGTPIGLAISPSSWSFPRSVIVTAVDDAAPEGPHVSTIAHVVSSADPAYDGMAVPDVSVSVTDNDAVGLEVVESGGGTAVAEEGPTSDSYTLSMLKAPAATVTVGVACDGQVDLGAGPGVAIDLTFTTSNWNVARQITVAAVDDGFAEGPHVATITHTSSSADPEYDGLAVADVVAQITDNDTAGVRITEPGGATAVSEQGPTSDTYSLVLLSPPTGDVTVTVSPDTQTTVGNGPGAPRDFVFSTGDWSVPQTVTVTAVDDALVEGVHTSIVSHSVASADSNYAGVATDDVSVQVTDNDLAAVSITESGDSTNVSEDGPTADAYVVELASQPAADVTVTIDPDEQTDLGSGAGVAIALLFTDADWDVPQTVTVTAVDDAVAEGNHASTLAHASASTDPNYDALPVDSVVASVADNDVAGVVIAESSGSTDVNESGPTADTYTVALSSKPTLDVVVTVDPDNQVNLGSGPGGGIALTFTALNWDTPQVVTVTAVDDSVAEGPHLSLITHSAASGDSMYDGITVSDVIAIVSDNDSVGVAVVESGGSTAVAEAGPTSDGYTLTLNSQPTATVSITVDPDAQCDLGNGPGSAIVLVFSTANWSAPQTVTVTAVDDDVAEGAHVAIISHSASSADAYYHGISISNVTSQVTDNDSAGVVVLESSGSTQVGEAGPTSDSYTLRLNSEPTAGVTLTVDPDVQVDLGNGAGAAITHTFTPADWDVPQSVTVTAVDDDVAEGPHAGQIVHTATSGDGNYDGIGIANVAAQVTDNDSAGVTIAQSGGSTEISENGPTSDTYTIVLESQPTGNVTITVDPDAQSSVGAGGGVPVDLLFTAGDWDSPQSVTVTAVDDAVQEGPHDSTITHTAASTDTVYDGMAIADVVANVQDNDIPGVTIIESGGSTDVSETGPTSDSFTIALDSQPAANVTVTIDPDMQADVGGGAGVATTRTFGVLNWNTPQSVTVTAVDDDVDEGAHTATLVQTAASTDSDYDGIAIVNVVAAVTDNDTAGIIISESGGATSVSEDGPTSDTYTILLGSRPTGDVTVTVDPDAQSDAGDGPGAPHNVVIAPGTWNVPRTVVVTAVDDAVAEGPHTSTLTHSVTSIDGNYDGRALADLTVSVTDNDLPGVIVQESGGSTAVSEAGPTSDAFTLVLQSPPAGAVTIAVSPDMQTDLGNGPGGAINLVFTDANWSSPQTISATAVDDNVAEGAHASTIAHVATSSDLNYDALPIASVVASVADNDVAAIVIAESGGGTSVDEQGPTSDTYTIVLGSQPTASVVVTVDPDNQTNVGGGAGTPVVLGFNSANWNSPQTVVVTAVDDDVAEGAHVSSIVHAAASADGFYDGIAISTVVAAVDDNDAVGVAVSETGGSTSVSESGPTSDVLTLVLGSQPTANVTVLVDPDGQTDVGSGAGNPRSLVFTSANWSSAQTVVVTAVDDHLAEGTHTSTIAFAVTSADPGYDGQPVGPVIASVNDNDAVGVVIAESDGFTAVNEAGPTSDAFTVHLNSRPTAGVTITISPDVQVDLGAGAGVPRNVTFTTDNWDTAQAIVVTAVDDADPEGPHVSTITHAATSIDPGYDGLPVADITVSVVDNDVSGVTLSETAGGTAVREDGPTSDTYSIVLTAPPTADLTLTADPDEQTDLGAGPGQPVALTFSPQGWNVTRTVVVTAVDDLLYEGEHTSTIAHSASSADPSYDGISVASISVTVTDNDSAGVIVTPTDGTTSVSEDGSTPDTYSLRLTAPPDSEVTITAVPDGQLDLGAGPAAAVTLGFSAANWATPQTLAVVAVDDRRAEGLHSGQITHASASGDPAFDGISIASVLVSISDDDQASVAFALNGGSLAVSESGPTSDTYTVRLASQPAAEVAVRISPEGRLDLGAGAGEPVELRFTPADWDAEHTVTVTAVDDRVADGAGVSMLAHALRSADPTYDGVAAPALPVSIEDNDVAGLVVRETEVGAALGEASAQGTTILVALLSQPLAPVAVLVQPDQQADLGAGAGVALELSISPNAWDVEQSLTVRAVDDLVVEGPHSATVRLTCSSTDPNYDAAGALLTLAVADDDTAGVALEESGGATRLRASDTSSDTYALGLLSQPLTDVLVTVMPEELLDVGAGPGAAIQLSFSPQDWSVPRTVVVTADVVGPVDGERVATIRHHVESADAAFHGLAVPDVIVVIAEGGDGAPAPDAPAAPEPPADSGDAPPPDVYTETVTVTVHDALPCAAVGLIPMTLFGIGLWAALLPHSRSGHGGSKRDETGARPLGKESG